MCIRDRIKRIPLARFTERSSGDYLNALTANVNDYEQILTHLSLIHIFRKPRAGP